MVGHVNRMVEGGNAFKILTGKLTVEVPIRRPRHGWEGNIIVYLKEISVNMRN